MTSDFEERFLTARRAVIASRFSNLNDMQLQAALTTEGPLLLLAGAGSGKTTVLINRIANLISFGCAYDSAEIPDYVTDADVLFLEDWLKTQPEADRAHAYALSALRPVAPWSIIAITFTNKAANELKDRLAHMLGEEALDVWAMTFHSACCRILRRDIERLGYDRSFTIYDTSDSERVIKDVLRDMSLDEKVFAPRMVLSQISRAKDKRLDPLGFERTAAFSGDYRMEKIALIYSEYQKRLKEANALDFDDIILKTVELLESFEDVRTYYQKKFRYVLIDEYQDTNQLQYQLSSLLAGGYENICVVGDDDQSIYKFRGATIENILNFEKQYKNARTIRLEQNYRSTGRILDAANHVIANNTGRKGKTLWTKAEAGDPLTLYCATNENDEARYVATKIMDDFGHGMNFRDHAVLYRMNAQSNQLEYAFKRNGIPYRIIGGTRFFDRAEVKDMLAYLCVIQTPGDDLRLTRIINTPARGIGARTVETAAQLAHEQQTSLFEVIRHADAYPELQRSQMRLRQFAILIEELQAAAKTMPPDELYDLVVERSGYVRALEEKNTAEDAARIENVQELKSNIIAFAKEAENPTLAGFLDEVALYTDLDNYDQSADCVTLMTMHAAKGLEFPTVFIIGCEEGIFPGLRPAVPAKAIRPRFAIKRGRLGFSYSLSRMQAIPGSRVPSRYSSEAPPPVEMWLILSPKPSCCTAAALSPPPMMVVASVSASALATAMVPAASTGFSKTPIGPFHTTVLASFTASAYSSRVLGPISIPIRSAGILSLSTTSVSMGASMGFGNSAVVTVSTGSTSFTPFFSAFAIISLQ